MGLIKVAEISIDKLEDRKTVTAILHENGYTVGPGKRKKTETGKQLDYYLKVYVEEGTDKAELYKATSGKTNVKTYTPKETTSYENLVKLFYNEAAKGKMFPEGAMLDVRIIAYYEIPKSTSKKKRREMLEHRIRPTKKPDWDNIGKIVCDSLNLVAYHDDSAVVDAQVRKFYSETPRVDVMIKVVGPDQI